MACFFYKQELFRKDNGEGVRFSRKDIMGDFDMDKRPETVEFFINNGYLEGRQGKLRWTLTMRNPAPLSNGNNRFYTEPGANGVQRYVIDMYKSRPNYKYYLLIREGSPGKVRFDHIKIERMNTLFRRNQRL